MNTRVCILNYGSGNVRSVFNMLETFEKNVAVSNNPADIQEATHIILPGVGAFGASMEKIRKKIALNILEEEILNKKKPFLGICVGMQILAEKGFEFGEHEGLGWIPGEVRKLETCDLPLPHVGWNTIKIVNENPVLENLDEQDFYFVHSFAFQAKDRGHAAAKTEYGEEFTSVISKDNIFGVQFHPEKSQGAGKILLQNFLLHDSNAVK